MNNMLRDLGPDWPYIIIYGPYCRLGDKEEVTPVESKPTQLIHNKTS